LDHLPAVEPRRRHLGRRIAEVVVRGLETPALAGQEPIREPPPQVPAGLERRHAGYFSRSPLERDGGRREGPDDIEDNNDTGWYLSTHTHDHGSDHSPWTRRSASDIGKSPGWTSTP